MDTSNQKKRLLAILCDIVHLTVTARDDLNLFNDTMSHIEGWFDNHQTDLINLARKIDIATAEYEPSDLQCEYEILARMHDQAQHYHQRNQR